MFCLIAFGVALYLFVSGPKSSDLIEYSAKNSDSNNGEYIYLLHINVIERIENHWFWFKNTNVRLKWINNNSAQDDFWNYFGEVKANFFGREGTFGANMTNLQNTRSRALELHAYKEAFSYD